MITLSALAESIWDSEFYWREDLKDTRYATAEEERAAEVVIIADWLDAHLGELNVVINTNFSSNDLGEVADMQDEESAILREMYLFNYYRKQSRNTLRALDGSTAMDGIDFPRIGQRVGIEIAALRKRMFQPTIIVIG